MRIELNEGKYTYVFHESGGQEALRYGEPWRSLTGDNLVYWMACRIVELEEQVQIYAEKLRKELG